MCAYRYTCEEVAGKKSGAIWITLSDHLRERRMLRQQLDMYTWGGESLVGVNSKKNERRRKTRDRKYKQFFLRTFAEREQKD